MKTILDPKEKTKYFKKEHYNLQLKLIYKTKHYQHHLKIIVDK